jgi:hypothetical protein
MAHNYENLLFVLVITLLMDMTWPCVTTNINLTNPPKEAKFLCFRAIRLLATNEDAMTQILTSLMGSVITPQVGSFFFRLFCSCFLDFQKYSLHDN